MAKQYHDNGYVSEDTIFDALIENCVPLDQADYLCETLLSMGIIIKNDIPEQSDESFVLDHSQSDFNKIYQEVIEIDDSLTWLINEVKAISPPQTREWQVLVPQAQNGNFYAKNRLVNMYLRQVIKQALYYHQRYGFPLDDTIQNGIVGLYLAIEKYEIEKAESFGQYLPLWIRQQILRESEPVTTCVRCPVHYKDKMFVLLDMLSEKHLSINENLLVNTELLESVAEKLEFSTDEVIKLIVRLLPPASIEEAIEENPNLLSDNNALMYDMIDKLEVNHINHIINKILTTSKEKEQVVIMQRFALNDINNTPKTLEEVGNIMGVTRERIRQIESKMLKRLRRVLGKQLREEWYDL